MSAVRAACDREERGVGGGHARARASGARRPPRARRARAGRGGDAARRGCASTRARLEAIADALAELERALGQRERLGVVVAERGDDREVLDARTRTPARRPARSPSTSTASKMARASSEKPLGQQRDAAVQAGTQLLGAQRRRTPRPTRPSRSARRPRPMRRREQELAQRVAGLEARDRRRLPSDSARSASRARPRRVAAQVRDLGHLGRHDGARLRRRTRALPRARARPSPRRDRPARPRRVRRAARGLGRRARAWWPTAPSGMPPPPRQRRAPARSRARAAAAGRRRAGPAPPRHPARHELAAGLASSARGQRADVSLVGGDRPAPMCASSSARAPAPRGRARAGARPARAPTASTTSCAALRREALGPRVPRRARPRPSRRRSSPRPRAASASTVARVRAEQARRRRWARRARLAPAVASMRRASGGSAASTPSSAAGLRRAASHHASSEASESDATSPMAASASAAHQRCRSAASSVAPTSNTSSVQIVLARSRRRHEQRHGGRRGHGGELPGDGAVPRPATRQRRDDDGAPELGCLRDSVGGRGRIAGQGAACRGAPRPRARAGSLRARVPRSRSRPRPGARLAHVGADGLRRLARRGAHDDDTAERRRADPLVELDEAARRGAEGAPPRARAAKEAGGPRGSCRCYLRKGAPSSHERPVSRGKTGLPHALEQSRRNVARRRVRGSIPIADGRASTVPRARSRNAWGLRSGPPRGVRERTAGSCRSARKRTARAYTV